MAKIISVSEAVDLIHNGMTVGISGFGAYASPDSILEGIGKKFREQNSPRDLTIVSGVAPGDFDDNGCGMSKIADDGIVDTLIASHLQCPLLWGVPSVRIRLLLTACRWASTGS